MKLFYKIVIFLLLTTSAATAQDIKSYKINIDYKAYWFGFVVADIKSETIIDHNIYEIKAHYNVSGVAAIFNQSVNDTLSRGIIMENQVFRPEYYESKGNFGKFIYSNEVTFDPMTLKVTEHVQQLTLAKNREYVPIADEEKYGADPLSIYLNMIMNEDFNNAYKNVTTTRQFGGLFVSEQYFQCAEHDILQEQKYSRFQGQTTICEIDGKLLSGNIKSTKPRKKRRKNRADDDHKSQIWFGKMQGLDAMIPIYTEFPIGWGKVKIYIDNFVVEEIKTDFLNTQNHN